MDNNITSEGSETLLFRKRYHFCMFLHWRRMARMGFKICWCHTESS